jgi:hypothetical protein
MKMKNKLQYLYGAQVLIALLIYSTCSFGQLVAFPGAQGYGANTIGGRGGQVIKVTTLADSGPGSFREAVQAPARHWLNGDYQFEPWEAYLVRLEASGHRIVIFEVSGIINLESELTISYPFITIAGQTSPGGILVTGYQTTVNTWEVIIRHMRFRVGTHRILYDRDALGEIIYYSQPQYNFPPINGTCAGSVTTPTNGYPCAIEGGADPEKLDSFDILGQYWATNEAYNIIIDHCSFSWGVDETVTITGGVLNATVQWSIVTEGLRLAGHPKGERSMGMLISGKYVNPTTISLHHNYIAHNYYRTPLIASPNDVDTVADIVNNISYNWKGGMSPYSGGAAKVNWTHNYMKQGASSNSYSFEVSYHDQSAPAPMIFVEGNIGSTRLNQSQPQWNVGDSWQNLLLSEDYRTLTAWSAPAISTTEMSYDYALQVLNDVGATYPVRDNVDFRVVTDFGASTGDIIDNINFPSDYPIYQNLPIPVDSDNDGMPDLWEISNHLNPLLADNNNIFPSGYTAIEEYINGLTSTNSQDLVFLNNFESR